MPLIPSQTSPTVAPAGAPGVFEHVNAGPEHFGGLEAAATAKLGGSLDQLGDVLAKGALAFQQLHNETRVEDHNNGFEAAKRDILFAPDTGFYSKQGKDAIDAMQPTAEQIEELRKQTRDALENPEQRRMFDYMSRRATRQDLTGMEAHANREAQTWRMTTLKGSITNAINDSAANWGDTPRFAQSLGLIKLQAEKLAAQQGVDPASESGKALVTHYQSEAWGARIHSVMAQDPDLAREMFDANADQMDAPHRAMIEQQITSHQWTKMVRDESETRRQDVQAERTLRTAQTATLATWTANTLRGKPPTDGQLADLVDRQQLAPHAIDFLRALSRRKGAGAEEDNALAVIELHKTLNNPTLSIDEKTKAIADAVNLLKPATAGSLVDQAYTRETRGESAEARQDLSATLHAVGVPDGMVNLDHDEQRRKAAVLIEFNDRVRKGEPSAVVRNDLIERFSPPGIPPVTWPRPKMGAINSSQEAAAIAVKTKAAADAGEIPPEQYQIEKANIVRYQQFWQAEEARKAASAAALKQKQPASGDKAKLKGVVAGGGNG